VLAVIFQDLFLIRQCNTEIENILNMSKPHNQNRSWLKKLRCQFLYIILFLTTLLIFGFNVIHAQKVHCELKKVSDSSFAGLCRCKDSIVFILNLKPFPSMGQNFWKGKSAMRNPLPNDPIFLEVRGNGGTLGTQYLSQDGAIGAWYKITDFKNNGKDLEFFFDLTELSKPSDRDIAILQRVKKYVSDSSKWSRNDNRYFAYTDCQSNSKQKSLFCALYAAQIDILGDFFAGPTFWALGNAITKHGEFIQHPFQEFNNDLKFSFNTLQLVIDEAIAEIKSSIKQSR
jgi:hypothetical protein